MGEGRRAGTGSRRESLKYLWSISPENKQLLSGVDIIYSIDHFDSEALRNGASFLFYDVSMLTDLLAFHTSASIMKVLTFSDYTGLDLP